MIFTTVKPSQLR
ncbi:hypothetical protein YPPY58_3499, partial [Yersinia pestis PY-58]